MDERRPMIRQIRGKLGRHSYTKLFYNIQLRRDTGDAKMVLHDEGEYMIAKKDATTKTDRARVTCMRQQPMCEERIAERMTRTSRLSDDA